MKIAIILPHFYPYVGGGEKMFYDLAMGLVKLGHEVHVVARNVGEEYLGYRRLEQLEVWYCPWRSMFGHPFPKESDIEPHIAWCDLVHTSIFTTSPVVSRLARKYHKPSVLTIYEARGSKWYWADNWFRATAFFLVEQYTCRQKFDCYHAISDATKRDIEKYIGKKNVKRVYLANELGKTDSNSDFLLRRYFDVPEDAKVFLYYGRPGKTKGVQIYEQAITEAKTKCPDIRKKKVWFCFLLGREPEDLRAEFIKKVKKDGLDEIVRIRDSVNREELEACIRQADVVVVPSLTEGFGFSALEACQIGTKLIYSDGGSLPEVAYGTCRSFQNRNVEDLADKLMAAIEEREDAFDTVAEKTFTYEEMLGGIVKLYGEVVKEC